MKTIIGKRRKGKTTRLVKRAVKLARKGNKVIVVSFNQQWSMLCTCSLCSKKNYIVRKVNIREYFFENNGIIWFCNYDEFEQDNIERKTKGVGKTYVLFDDFGEFIKSHIKNAVLDTLVLEK